MIARYFPDAPALYAAQGWQLPCAIDRVYDASRIERVLGWRPSTDFAALLAALCNGAALPFVHDAKYVSPILTS